MACGALAMDAFDRFGRGLVRADSGQDLIEYSLLAALLALGTMVATQTLTGAIINTFWVRIVEMLVGAAPA